TPALPCAGIRPPRPPPARFDGASIDDMMKPASRISPLLSGYPLLGTNATSGTYIKALRSGWRRSGQNIFIAITAGRDALALPRLLYNAQALQSRIYDPQ